MSKKGVVTVSILTGLVLVMLLAFMGGGTYARYALSIDGSGSASIAKWAVKVNGREDANFNLTFRAENNTDIVAGKIAPGVTATAYVDVDLTGTEVSVQFDCELSNAASFAAGTVSVGTPTLSTGASDMTLDTANKIVKVGSGAMNGSVRVPITLTWTGDADANDTALGKAGNTLEVPVTLSVKQYIDSAS